MFPLFIGIFVVSAARAYVVLFEFRLFAALAFYQPIHILFIGIPITHNFC